MLRAAAGCLVACRALAAAAGPGDSLSLLQAGVHSQPAGQGNLQPKADGGHKVYYIEGSEFTFNRRVDALEPNSSVNFSLQKGCKATDQHGVNKCALRWFALNKGLFSVHLGTGFHRGDKIYSSVTSNAMTHNTFAKGMAGLFDGEEFEVTSLCQLCEGACSISYKKLSFHANLSFPTLVDDPTICNSLDKVTDFNILNATRLPSGPFGGYEFDAAWLKMTGDVNIRIGVDDREGNKRLDETLSFQVGVHHTPTPTATPMLLQLMQGQERREARSLLGVLREAVHGSFWQVLSGKTSRHATAEQAGMDDAHSPARRQKKLRRYNNRPSRKKPVFQKDWSEDVKRLLGKLNAVSLSFKVWLMENGDVRNISIAERKYCASVDAMGSFDCKIPFNKDLALKINAHLETYLQEGDTLDLKVESKVDGPLGGMLKSFLQPMRLTLALCGNKTQQLTIMNKTVDYFPLKCGLYKLNAELPPWHTMLADLSDMPLVYPKELQVMPLKAMLPKTVGAMPTFKVGLTATMKRKDATPYGSYGLELGLE